uniref:Uncharacterized protein n=1 Tax=Caenorhabditis japonica TaxID=281687 RepID=A0A8R1I8P5_CAEJA
MNSFIFLPIFASFLTIYANNTVPNELRQEFQEIAAGRLEYLLKHELTPEPFLTMSILLTDCQIAAGLPKIFNGWKQSILEEETCGTPTIRKWCAEKPGRAGMMTIRGNAVSSKNRTALVNFRCHFMSESRDHHHGSKSQKHVIEKSINFLVVLSIVGMAYCWYVRCSRPKPLHPSKILSLDAKNESDSFENITFNSTLNRSRVSLKNRSTYSENAKKFRIIV